MVMKADVAIVGFGPVGAVLAGLLSLRGLRVVVVERDTQVFPQPRAAHIDHTGLRTIQELGCLETLLPKMVRNKSLDLVNASHQLLVRVPANQDSVSGLPTSVYFYQPEFDAVLRDTVSAMPNVEVHLGTTMTHVEQMQDGVLLHARDEDGKTLAIPASWLVGCDGAWSPVREMMGIQLESLNFDEPWLVLDLALNSPQPELPTDHVVQVCDPVRPHLTTPISSHHQRFEFMLLSGENLEDVRKPESVARLLGPWLPPDSYTIERSAGYVFHGLVARQWRKGHVLIAGDAAHQMPPFLGQGMCSGIRDASNLAWKLALVVKQDCPESLLDTYEEERSPHVRAIVEAAIEFGRMVCEVDPKKAEERDRHFLEGGKLSDRGFALPRLTRGRFVQEGGGSLFIQPTIDGRRLDDIVGQRFLVVGRNAETLGSSTQWWRSALDAAIFTLDEMNDANIARWLDRFGADVVVVRPDRYVLGVSRKLDVLTDAVRRILAHAREKSPASSLATTGVA
jgi:3-(3-hydroxy-phenyl)propionate hydroxylase